jgi:hypothetical protein
MATRFAACVLFAILALLIAAPPGVGAPTASVYGRVLDEQGVPLAGVLVTLTGVGAPLSARTTTSGEIRFLNLSPGEYVVEATQPGFAAAHRGGLALGSRQSVEVTLVLKIAGRAESVNVTAEAPLLDMRRSNVGANVGSLELERIPTARDPWAVIQSIPGTQMDRVNVGGSETGSQSYFSSKGMPPAQNAWTLDGIDINQTAGATGLGSTPSYFDFDSLQEIQLSTGGTDPSTQTAGAQVNLVTKRGTNAFRGSARFLGTAKPWVAKNTPDVLARQLAAGGSNPASNRVVDAYQFGGEVGGPLVRDRLWFWSGYDRSQTNLTVAGGLRDNTTLTNVTFKVSAQPRPDNTLTLFYNRADKVKLGRDAGTTRPQETTWDQTGPNTTYKVEDSHVFSQKLFASAAVAYKDFGFRLDPEGSGQMRQDAVQVFHNTYFANIFVRPQAQGNAGLSYFFRSGTVGHEVKLGGRFFYSRADDRALWEGNVVACNAVNGVGANWCGSQRIPAVELNRDLVVPSKLFRYSGWIADTLTLPRLTLNVGLRYDRQRGENSPSSIPGSKAASLVPTGTILPPPLDLPASDPGFRWTNWQPRVGATYAVDAAKRTLVRVAYARYAHQMGSKDITGFSAAPGVSGAGTTAAGAGIVYPWNDLNGDNQVDVGEIDTSRVLRAYGFDPADPTRTSSSINSVDRDFGAPVTDEGTLGVDHAFSPTLAVSLLGTYRRISNFELATGIGLTGSDFLLSTVTYRQNGLNTNPPCPRSGYACGTLPGGAAYEVPVYRASPAATARLSPGQHSRNNPGYHQTYAGLELQVIKRYAGHWMARLSASYGDWRQHYGQDGYLDPTNIAVTDGGLAVVQSIGSGDKQRVYINAKWQSSLWALWTLPRGFEVSGAFLARQGYPIAYFQNVSANPNTTIAYEQTRSLVVAPYDRYRLDDVTNLDLGIAKAVKIRRAEVRLVADVFNVLNENTVFQRQSQVGVAGPNGTNSIREVMAPRALRLGARLSF